MAFDPADAETRDAPQDRPYVGHLEEPGALIDEVVEVDRQLAAHAAARAVAIDAARLCSERTDRRGGALSADMNRRSLIAELACALRVPERTAADLLESSHSPVHALPTTLDALHRGVISYRHATIMVNQTAGLDGCERALPGNHTGADRHRPNAHAARSERGARQC